MVSVVKIKLKLSFKSYIVDSNESRTEKDGNRRVALLLYHTKPFLSVKSLKHPFIFLLDVSINNLFS